MNSDYPMEYYQFFISFNEGDYYTCHDLIEEIWMTDKQNHFLKGLLQTSVAIYHYEYGNVKGARLMFQRAVECFKPYPKHFWGLDTEELLTFVKQCLKRIPEIDTVPYEETGKLPVLPKIYLYLKEDI
jgi:predicted metal-dependent hydrolase